MEGGVCKPLQPMRQRTLSNRVPADWGEAGKEEREERMSRLSGQ